MKKSIPITASGGVFFINKMNKTKNLKIRPIKKKGQLFSLDLVASVVIFIILFAFIISLWNLYSTRLSENIYSEELQLLSFQITDLLVKSQGEPTNWENNPENVSVIGLKLNPNYLDSNKINAFLTLDYNLTKELFNIERFDFNFKILDLNGNTISETGLSSPETNSYIISNKRLVIIQNETRQISFTLWKEQN